ncbi:MAG: 1,4-dihydroxy-2-naphthoate polyprenyltransferase [Bdellovibrionales bacterium]|nr:1,4-dihydroxy-2-naphthoate polyprenyltransferase [Bdellovibrionales bacterium]
MSTLVLKPWLMAFRPKTLTAAVVPVLVGTALAFRVAGETNLWMSLWAVLGALFIQVGTNLFNDALDFKKGADTAERLGPQRVTQSGLISAKGVMWAGALSFGLAVLCGIPLVIEGGWVIVGIGLVSLFFGYAYTGGPFPLAYKGLGDIFVILFFGWVAVGGVYFLHTGRFDQEVWVAGSQVGLLATVLIAINNLRDVHQDQKVNKKTLAVRFGVGFARAEITLLLLASFILSGYWLIKGHWAAAFLPLVVAPLAWGVVKGVQQNEPGPVFNSFLARAGLIHLLFGLQLSLGLFLT